MTKVKICGITNLEDGLLAAQMGAHALGFNFYTGSPRYISPVDAQPIIEQIPVNILNVGVFVNESLEVIVETVKYTGIQAVQLHGEETPEFVRKLKARTNLKVIKAFRISNDFRPEDVLKYEVDAVLLDAYSPSEHGGTSETFDWIIAANVQRIFPKVYLAGGLSSENVAIAVTTINPYGVDACSGLEVAKGRKDPQKLRSFFAALDHAC